MQEPELFLLQKGSDGLSQDTLTSATDDWSDLPCERDIHVVDDKHQQS